MTVRILLSFFIFIGFGVSFAQESNARKFPMAEHSLLWQISGNDINGNVYLFGTIHLIEKDKFFFPKKLKKITTQSNSLIMEIAGIPDASELTEHIRLEEGHILDPFSENQKDSIYAWVKNELSFTKEAFDAFFGKLKPFVIVQLSLQLSMKGDYESYEMNFQEIAEENSITVLGLETAEEQLNIFNGLSDEETVTMVMESIRESNETKETQQKMNELYVEQDLDGLYQLITKEGSSSVDLEKRLLIDRNNRWVIKLKDMIKSDNILIAVGAGHLGGPEGLIRLLESEGYTLSPVKL